MKRFLTSSAIVIALSTGAYAQTSDMGIGTVTEKEAQDFFGSDLIGMRIYRSETEMDSTTPVAAGAEQEWDDIGEINDLLITPEGNIHAVILGIGGFLGLGERDVTVNMDAIKILSQEGDSDDRFLVVTASQAQLEDAPEFGRTETDMEEPTETAAAVDTDTDTDTTMDMDMDTTLERPMVEREGYAEVDMTAANDLTASDIEGARVYGANDEDLGEVSTLIVEGEKLTDAVIDVGGFLGLGEKQVSVPFEQLQVMQNADGGDLRIYMEATEEKLEAMPEYVEG